MRSAVLTGLISAALIVVPAISVWSSVAEPDSPPGDSTPVTSTTDIFDRLETTYQGDAPSVVFRTEDCASTQGLFPASPLETCYSTVPLFPASPIETCYSNVALFRTLPLETCYSSVSLFPLAASLQACGTVRGLFNVPPTMIACAGPLSLFPADTVASCGVSPPLFTAGPFGDCYGPAMFFPVGPVTACGVSPTLFTTGGLEQCEGPVPLEFRDNAGWMLQ
jgi:hypothetical protein